ncbi:hypothetical protein Aduo_015260 [Ancylostoma duodenale]
MLRRSVVSEEKNTLSLRSLLDVEHCLWIQCKYNDEDDSLADVIEQIALLLLRGLHTMRLGSLTGWLQTKIHGFRWVG